MDEEKVLDISWGTILKVAIVFLGIYILFLIRDILVWTIFGLIISILFNPPIDFLERKRMPRAVATIIIYTVAFTILSLVFYWIIPIFISEIQQMTKLFPQYFEKVAPPLRGLQIEAFNNFETFTQVLQDWLRNASSSIFAAIISIFGGIFSTVTIFAIAIFFSMEDKDIGKAITLLAPKNNEDYFLDLWKRCQTKTAHWFGTRILSSLFVGVVSYVALEVIKLKYAFILSLFAGIMDIIPVLGPIFAGLVIVLLAALEEWWKALFVLIAFVLIQQIEGNIVTPLLTKKMVGLPSVLVLIALMIGGRLWGVLGAVLAIPLTSIIYEFTRDFLKGRKNVNAESP